jgi:RNA polymerase sigma factor (sigma-70 family)
MSFRTATNRQNKHTRQNNSAPQDFTDDYALGRVNYRVARLTRAFRLGEHDAEDLRSRMKIQLLRAASRFDPSRASRCTFINRVLDRAYRHIARELHTRRGHGAWNPTQFSESDAVAEATAAVHAKGADPADGVARRIDLDAALASLPRPLRAICEELKHASPREVSERLALHRSTVYRAIAQVRAHFESCGLEEAA